MTDQPKMNQQMLFDLLKHITTLCVAILLFFTAFLGDLVGPEVRGTVLMGVGVLGLLLMTCVYSCISGMLFLSRGEAELVKLPPTVMTLFTSSILVVSVLVTWSATQQDRYLFARHHAQYLEMLQGVGEYRYDDPRRDPKDGRLERPFLAPDKDQD